MFSARAPRASEPAPPILLGQSPVMTRLRAQLERYARSDATVLITGDTGTGKEMVARWIHAHSARRDGPFVALNCAALPESLIENELFGHASGAFTGAHQAYPGKVRLAAGGTLFLDEIGDMAPLAQARLLRFLDSGEVFSVGGHRAECVDVRIVAATNHDLAERVRQGQFRKDMYYRLNIVAVELRPLCERRGDLDQLVDHFLAQVRQRHALQVDSVSEPVRKLFMRYPWPGNVRELRNVLESAALQADGSTLQLHHLPAHVTAATPAPPPLDERAQLIRALHESHGNKSAAAEQLHCSRMTLYRRLHKYQLDAPPPHPAK